MTIVAYLGHVIFHTVADLLFFKWFFFVRGLKLPNRVTTEKKQCTHNVAHVLN